MVFYSASECRCSAEHGKEKWGKLYGHYCKKWEDSDTDEWCYLDGVGAACPGAQKSTQGNFYYSSHEDICGGKTMLMKTKKS